MSVKNVLLVGLVLVNLLVLTALVVELTTPRPAQAAGDNFRVNYAVVTARLLQGEDGLWILDQPHNKIYVYRMPQANGEKMMKYVGMRDLAADLRNERDKDKD